MAATARRLWLVGIGVVIVSAGPAPPKARPEAFPLPETVAEGAGLVEVYRSAHVHGGPSWDPRTGKLYFTTAGRGGQILRLDAAGKATVWLDKAGGVSGTCLSRDGRLLGAEAARRRIVGYGIGPDGPIDVETLVHDPTLVEPSDLCQSPSGDVYFTYPDFKAGKAGVVFRLLPDGRAVPMIRDMRSPSGVEVAPDGRTIYVGDAAMKLWRSYPVAPNGDPGIGKFWFNPATRNRDNPAGMAVDDRGNVYMTGRGGVWVATPEGKMLGLIPVKEPCTNVAFGGDDGSTLFITCQRKVYSLAMTVRGPGLGKTP
jgi:gluconolactonase